MKLKPVPLRKDGKTQRCGHASDEWPVCTACGGRMHLPTCTTRRNKHKDCCPERHKMLHDTGQKRGIVDSSIVMWPEN